MTMWRDSPYQTLSQGVGTWQRVIEPSGAGMTSSFYWYYLGSDNMASFDMQMLPPALAISGQCYDYFSWKLLDAPWAADFVSVYRAFRVLAMEINIRPLKMVSSDTPTGSEWVGLPHFFSFYAPDSLSSTPFILNAGDPISKVEQQFCRYQSFHRGSPGGYYRRRFVPKTYGFLYSTTGGIAGTPAFEGTRSWIACDSDGLTVQHRGLMIGRSWMGDASLEPYMSFHIFWRLKIQVRGHALA